MVPSCLVFKESVCSGVVELRILGLGVVVEVCDCLSRSEGEDDWSRRRGGHSWEGSRYWRCRRRRSITLSGRGVASGGGSA
jgi:hypothetical protein